MTWLNSGKSTVSKVWISFLERVTSSESWLCSRTNSREFAINSRGQGAPNRISLICSLHRRFPRRSGHFPVPLALLVINILQGVEPVTQLEPARSYQLPGAQETKPIGSPHERCQGKGSRRVGRCLDQEECNIQLEAIEQKPCQDQGQPSHSTLPPCWMLQQAPSQQDRTPESQKAHDQRSVWFSSFIGMGHLHRLHFDLFQGWCS